MFFKFGSVQKILAEKLKKKEVRNMSLWHALKQKWFCSSKLLLFEKLIHISYNFRSVCVLWKSVFQALHPGKKSGQGEGDGAVMCFSSIENNCLKMLEPPKQCSACAELLSSFTFFFFFSLPCSTLKNNNKIKKPEKDLNPFVSGLKVALYFSL